MDTCFNNDAIAHTVYLCFLYDSHNKQRFQFVFDMEKRYVYWELRTEFLYYTGLIFSLTRVIYVVGIVLFVYQYQWVNEALQLFYTPIFS